MLDRLHNVEMIFFYSVSERDESVAVHRFSHPEIQESRSSWQFVGWIVQSGDMIIDKF